MSELSRGGGVLDELSRLSGQQWLLRASVPVATIVMVALQEAAGAAHHPLFFLVALGVSVVVALLPDSGAGLLLVLLLGGHWVLAVPEQVSGWLLMAALVLGVIHVATALAAYGPPGLVLDRGLLRLWAKRCAMLAGAATLTWLLALLLSKTAAPGGAWLMGVALVLLGGWALYVDRRMT